jgi:hypothetical protein
MVCHTDSKWIDFYSFDHRNITNFWNAKKKKKKERKKEKEKEKFSAYNRLQINIFCNYVFFANRRKERNVGINQYEP